MPAPTVGTAKLYSSQASGLIVQLPRWRYPIVIDPLVSSGWSAEGNQVDAFLGASVSTAGDVNGDGYSDVIVGAFNYELGPADEGRAFVIQPSGKLESVRSRFFFTSSVPQPRPGSVVTVPERDPADKKDYVAIAGAVASILASTVAIIIAVTR